MSVRPFFPIMISLVVSRVIGSLNLLLAGFVLSAMAVDLSIFRCRDLSGCAGGGTYACSSRNAVQQCDTGSNKPGFKHPSRIARAPCRLLCHFNPECHSYYWDENVGMCYFCPAPANDGGFEMNWTYPIEFKSVQKRPIRVQMGIHSGTVESITVMGIDYISKGYILAAPTEFHRQSAILAPQVEDIVFKTRGHFCVFLPEPISEETWKTTEGTMMTVPGELLLMFCLMILALGCIKTRLIQKILLAVLKKTMRSYTE